MPFGEDIFVGVGGRTGDTGQRYSSNADDIRQKFTGYQKDSETNLDFAEARMYENRHGRFTVVDPLIASGKSADPQTFNRYVYVGNNPIVKTDPSGMIFEWVHDKSAPQGINRPVWVSHDDFLKGGYTEWTELRYSTPQGEIVLDEFGPYSMEDGTYKGWSVNGVSQGTGIYAGAGAFHMDHNWLSRWQTLEYTPPGYAGAARYNGHGRFTIDADGETDYDAFNYNADKVIAFNLFASFENVYLGGSRQPPKIGSSRTVTSNFAANAPLEGLEGTSNISSRPSGFRRGIAATVWDRAQVGPNGGRLCSTCGKELFWKPGEGRLGVWEVDHNPKWRLRIFTGTRREVLNNFNDLETLRVRCILCNRSDN